MGCFGAAVRPQMTPTVAAVQLGYSTESEALSDTTMSSTPQYRCFDRGHCWNAAAPLFVGKGGEWRDGGMDEREREREKGYWRAG